MLFEGAKAKFRLNGFLGSKKWRCNAGFSGGKKKAPNFGANFEV